MLRFSLRLRKCRKNGRMTPQASLAAAEAARRTEERKHGKARAATDRLARLEQENDLAYRFRQAFNGR